MDKRLTLEFKVTKEENRDYMFTLPYGAPSNEAFSALQDFWNELEAMAKQAKEQQDSSSSESESDVMTEKENDVSK